MPRELPTRPNLEHLRNQARDLLRAYERGEPAAIGRFDAVPLRRVPRLADALLVLAREYGFDSWPKLKEYVETRTALSEDVLRRAQRAFQNDDAESLRQLLDEHPELKARINDPIGPFHAPLVHQARSRTMLDVLVDAGADVDARSRWWAGGFGLLECAPPDIARHAIRRGARVTVHGAARLGLLDELRELVGNDAALVRARGGDGQTPLHYASTVEVAAYLLEQGADIDARDVDHESTPAQYMLDRRTDVARFLVSRGCATDLLMAAALGDVELAHKHLEADPESIRLRVSDEYFPMVGSDRGGTIYQWTLGWYVSAPQVARARGYPELYDVLTARCPPDEQLINACWLGDETRVREIVSSYPRQSISASLRRHVAHAARNNDGAAAGLMLDAGLSPLGTFGQHHATALHWAAWHGNASLVQRLLGYRPDLEDTANEFESTPLGWAIHGSENAWDCETGDYPATVELLLDAGALAPIRPGGSDSVQAVLRRFGTA